MKILRLLLTLLAVAAAGFLAFRGMRGNAPAPAPKPDEAGKADPPGSSAWPTLPDAPKSAEPAPAPKTKAPVLVEEDPSPGTPVKADAEVSLVVPYRAGTKTRYRVSEGQLSRNIDPEIVQWWQFLWDVTTEVDVGAGDGAARIRFTIDSFEFQTEAQGRPVRFSSKSPEEALLADEALGLGRTMRPLMAICGMPLEFVIGQGGEITAIEGVPAMNRKYLDVVDAMGAAYVKDAIDAPSVENLTQRWSEILFPPLGGGKLKASEARDASLRTTYYERWSLVNAGKLRVVADDPGQFRVEFKAKPEMEELNRPAVSPISLAVEKARVLSDADAYRASWRFDRNAGRLAWGGVHARYRFDVSRRTGVDDQGEPIYDPHFTWIERRIVVEPLDK